MPLSWIELGLVMTAAIFAVGAWRLLQAPAPVVIDRRGILARGTGLGRIPWDEVVGAYQPHDRQGEAVRVQLRLTERLARRLRRRGKAIPDPDCYDLTLDLSGSGVSEVELFQAVLDYQR